MCQGLHGAAHHGPHVDAPDSVYLKSEANRTVARNSIVQCLADGADVDTTWTEGIYALRLKCDSERFELSTGEKAVHQVGHSVGAQHLRLDWRDEPADGAEHVTSGKVQIII
jgi:hypothetical protein